MTTLVTGDLHESDKPRDDYRWRFLEKTLPALIKGHEVDQVLILGDFTEIKDEHRSVLVNRLVDAIEAIAQLASVIGLRGNHDCCSSDTELLTSRGWLQIEDVRKTDQVVGFDLKTNAGVWQPIDEIIRKKATSLYEAQGRGYDIAVTRGHRVLTHKWGKYYYSAPEDVLKSHQILHAVQVSNPDYPLTDDELRVAGWIVTDGSIDQHGYIHLYQSKHVTQIDELLGKLKMQARHSIRKNNPTEICGRRLLKTPMPAHEWHICAADSRALLNRLSIKRDRGIPPWVMQLSKRQFQIFLETVVAADGNAVRNKKGWCFAIHKNLGFLSTLQAALACNGMRATISRGNRGHYVLNVSTRILSGTGVLVFQEKTKSDEVWCLRVKTSNFIVRRNGKVHVTGNCVNQDVPFFRFLRHLDNVRWINEPTRLKLRGLGACWFLPHEPDPVKSWDSGYFTEDTDWYFCHQTFAGSKSESGREMTGPPHSIFPRDVRVVSGDVHVPQKNGPVTYVGAPTTIDFGDRFEPRVLLLDGDRMRSIPVPGPQKRLVGAAAGRRGGLIFAGNDVQPGDVIKVSMVLDRSDISRAQARKEAQAWAEEAGVHLYAVEVVASAAKPEKTVDRAPRRSDEELVRAYAKKMSKGKATIAAGLKITEETP